MTNGCYAIFKRERRIGLHFLDVGLGASRQRECICAHKPMSFDQNLDEVKSMVAISSVCENE